MTFDDSFRGKPGAFEEDEAISIKPLFLETMGKQVVTLENESD